MQPFSPGGILRRVLPPHLEGGLLVARHTQGGAVREGGCVGVWGACEAPAVGGQLVAVLGMERRAQEFVHVRGTEVVDKAGHRHLSALYRASDLWAGLHHDRGQSPSDSTAAMRPRCPAPMTIAS